MTVKVAGVWDVSTTTKLFVLIHPTGGLLPRFTPGSHIVIHMRDGGKVHRNSYSLINGGYGEGLAYFIAVQLAPNSKGGSKYMHEKVARGSRTHDLRARELLSDGRARGQAPADRGRHRHYAVARPPLPSQAARTAGRAALHLPQRRDGGLRPLSRRSRATRTFISTTPAWDRSSTSPRSSVASRRGRTSTPAVLRD